MKAVVKVPLDFAIEGILERLATVKNILGEVISGFSVANPMLEKEKRKRLHKAEARIEDIYKILNTILKEECENGDEGG